MKLRMMLLGMLVLVGCVMTQPTFGPGTQRFTTSQVVGLDQALAGKAIKSSTFVVGRAAKINASGQIESVSGTLTDCVKVDGTSGACGSGSSGSNVVPNEVPATVTTTVYTLSRTPIVGTVSCRINGIMYQSGTAYTVSGAAITWVGGFSTFLSDTTNLQTCTYSY